MCKSMICFADRRVIPWLMAVFFFLGLIIPCNALSTTPAIPQVLSKKIAEPDTATRARLMKSYGRLPLSFEANHGQTDGKVKFLSSSSGYNLFLTATEAVLSLHKPQSKDKAAQGSALHKADKSEPATVVAMKLVGANADPKITGTNQLPGKVNYFLGKDPKKWRTNIPTYGKVRYTNVYPGIDLIYYGNGRKLEYDFIVAPGAEPVSIALSFGQMPVKIDPNGDLVLDTKQGDLRLQKPVIYQEIDGLRKPVTGGYVFHPVKNEKQTPQVGFKIAAYDRTRPLVIDPVLVYSTYLGGSNYDCGYGIALDASGNCFVTGRTQSTDFPTQDPLFSSNSGGVDAFVTCLNPAGDALVYSTYLGGNGTDYGNGIAVDASGNCFVTGWTWSSDFPTQDPLFSSNSGNIDAFVTCLNPAGDALVYSTYLGGSNADQGYGIAVDASGNCFVTGLTHSTDFPTQDPLFSSNSGWDDAFVCKISSATKDELAVDFRTLGIYVYNAGSWNRIYKGIDPEGLCSFGTNLAVDFGITYGLYIYDAGAWTRVYKGVAIEKMAGFGEKLAIDFGTAYPIYEYNYTADTWTSIYKYSSPRDTIEALGDKLVVDFKTAGIYVYDAGIWNRIYKGIDPVNIVSFGDKLAVDFGSAHGLYVYEYDTDNWTKIYKGVAIEKMAEIDGDLVVDFGTAHGLYVYEFDTDNWNRVYKGVAIEKMAGFDGNLAVDFGTTYPIYEYNFGTDNWNSIYNYSYPRDELVPANIFD